MKVKGGGGFPLRHRGAGSKGERSCAGGNRKCDNRCEGRGVRREKVCQRVRETAVRQRILQNKNKKIEIELH